MGSRGSAAVAASHSSEVRMPSTTIVSTRAPSAWRKCQRRNSPSSVSSTNRQRRRCVAADADAQQQSSKWKAPRRDVLGVGSATLVNSLGLGGFGLVFPQASQALTPPGFKKDLSK